MSLGTAIAQGIEMQERVSPSRPSRLGTRRRRPGREAGSQADALAAGASWPRKRPPSLDTDKQLQTTESEPGQSARDWLRSNETEHDRYSRQIGFHGQLLSSYHQLWQDYAAAAREAQNAGDTDAAEKMLKASAQWEKKWLRVHNCRTEWIAFRADCCKSKTQPMAVPVGCNDRLCPLCAWDRSRVARKRIKRMFDRLTHPALITLTIPNVPLFDHKMRPLSKRHYEHFRKRVRQFIKQHETAILGGVYSLETTYNRAAQTWHIHVHILADMCSPLPAKTEMTTVAGQRFCQFTVIKRKLEWDWMRLWTKDHGKRARKNASENQRLKESNLFEQWMIDCRENALKRWTPSGYVPLDLSPAEAARRSEWNRKNRRVVDVRPVTDRDGAAAEVLKYITKVADFSDCPEAVEAFANAVRGARLIQTFGSWYGVKIDTDRNQDAQEDWGDLQCSCGCNFWKAFAVVHRRDVQMDERGRWWLKRPHDYNSAGTVPRPTARAANIARGKAKQ